MWGVFHNIAKILLSENTPLKYAIIVMIIFFNICVWTAILHIIRLILKICFRSILINITVKLSYKALQGIKKTMGKLCMWEPYMRVLLYTELYIIVLILAENINY